MPELSLEPASTAANVNYRPGDCYFTDSTAAPEAEDGADFTLYFGKNNAKTPEVYGMAMHYDTSSIPLGATLNRVLLEMVPTATDTNGFTVDIDVLAPNSRLNQVSSQVHEANFRYRPTRSLFPLASCWDDENVATASSGAVPRHCNIFNGLGNVSQTWVSNGTAGGTQNLVQHNWRLGRESSTNSLQIRTNLYTAVGSNGNWRKGVLVDTGALVTVDDATFGVDVLTYPQTADHATVVSSFPTGVTIDNATRYVSELEFVGGTGSATRVAVGWGFEPNDDVDNLALYGWTDSTPDRVFQGFSGRTQFFDGTRIKGTDATSTAPVVAAGDSLTAPGFSVGVVYSFGNSGAGGSLGTVTYGPDTALPKFMENLQLALDSRASTSDWLGIRFNGFSASTNQFRQVFSYRHSTTTRGSLRGPVMTFDYTDPGAYLQRYEHTVEPNTSLRR